MRVAPIPPKGSAATEVLAELQSAKRHDLDWHSGKTNFYVQFGGDDVLQVARDAANLYFSENAHSAKAFPSLRQLQDDVLGWVLSLLGASSESDGCFTASGSESIFVAMKVARDWARARNPFIGVPKVIIPRSAHPAFDKAGANLGMEVVRVPLGADYRADVDAIAERICTRTVMLGASAPQLPHGVIDPIEAIAELAINRNLWLHVDACIGAMIAPFARAIGVAVPRFDFSVAGVRSISADLHKYGFAAKGASAILFRHHCWKPLYTFEFDDWPIGTYTSTLLAGTRPGGPIASAWAVIRYLGEEGYTRIAREIFGARDRLLDGFEKIEGIRPVCRPDLSVLAYSSENVAIPALAAEMEKRSWLVKTMVDPAAVHLGMLTMHQVPVVDEYLSDLEDIIGQIRRK